MKINLFYLIKFLIFRTAERLICEENMRELRWEFIKKILRNKENTLSTKKIQEKKETDQEKIRRKWKTLIKIKHNIAFFLDIFN